MTDSIKVQAEWWRVALLASLGLSTWACSEGTSERTAGPVAQPPLTPMGEVPTLTSCNNSMLLPESPGFERCENGLVRRREALACTDHYDQIPSDFSPPPQLTAVVTCSAHDDCTDRAHGYCTAIYSTPLPPAIASAIASSPAASAMGAAMPAPSATPASEMPFIPSTSASSPAPTQIDYVCQYGCGTDADCDAGFICNCMTPIGQCVQSTCTTDADCGGSFKCLSTGLDCQGFFVSFQCQTADDECASNTDCTSNNCAPSDGRLQCAPCYVSGRPFVVQGSERLAELVCSFDWANAALRPRLEELDSSERQALGQHWAGVGLMEHASIAAFARFALQLLQLGAPPGLVEQCHRALADELLHARMAFGLASTYLGKSVGPGPLAMDHALEATTLSAVLALVVREGCVGETAAALQAQHALAGCEEPVVRSVLGRIVEDEQEHAKLAWQFVEWALRQQPELVGVVAHELELASHKARLEQAWLDEVRVGEFGEGVKPLENLAHGLVAERSNAQVRMLALSEIVLPCAHALIRRARAAHGRAPSPAVVSPVVPSPAGVASTAA